MNIKKFAMYFITRESYIIYTSLEINLTIVQGMKAVIHFQWDYIILAKECRYVNDTNRYYRGNS